MYLISRDRFWDNVDVWSDPSMCWEWTGYRQKSGYGQSGSYRFGTRHTHVIAFVLANPDLDTRGLQIQHHCDNPPCCNPTHLYAGTQAQNWQDTISRGRSNKGTKHWNVKLTPDQIKEIRDDPRPSRIVGQEYGVNDSTIRKIRRGERW